LVILAKTVLIGDGAVGKTSLKSKYIGKGFPSNYLPTLGSDFVIKEVQINTTSINRKVKFQIWDIAGQPSFKQIRARYYNQAIGALLVFDVTRPDTLYDLEKWIEELSLNVKRTDVSVILIANKIDLRKPDHVTKDTIESFINKKLSSGYDEIDKPITFIETSAKTGENVQQAFQLLGTKILQNLYMTKL